MNLLTTSHDFVLFKILILSLFKSNFYVFVRIPIFRSNESATIVGQIIEETLTNMLQRVHLETSIKIEDNDA